MTEFYCPSPRAVTIPGTKRRFNLRRGIQEIPDELANHLDANTLGIITVDEMTDAQWASLALSKDVYMAARAVKAAAEAVSAGADADTGVVATEAPLPVPSASAAPAKPVAAKPDPIAAAAASVKATTK